MNRFVIIVIWVLLCQRAFAQSAPKYSNEFLAIGVNARGLGMANTQSAVANDVSAAYWNPAGLLQIKDKFQVALTHNQYAGGISNYDYAGFATALDESGRIAFSVIRLGTDNIPDTRQLLGPDGSINYDKIESFSVASYAFLFSYARSSYLMKGLRTGANFKVVHNSAGPFGNSWGLGIDAGAQLDLGKWQLGVMARDITSTINIWTFNTQTFADVFQKTQNEVRSGNVEITLPRLLLDAARRFSFNSNLGLLATSGLELTFDGKRNSLLRTNLASADLRAGLEMDYKKMVFLRAGIGNFQRIRDLDQKSQLNMQPNLGLGFIIKNISIDYALVNPAQGNQGLPASHIISLLVRLNDKK